MGKKTPKKKKKKKGAIMVMLTLYKAATQLNLATWKPFFYFRER